MIYRIINFVCIISICLKSQIYIDKINVKITKISYILLHCRNFLFKTQIIQQRIWKFCCYHLTRLFQFLIAWLRTNSFWKKKRKMESSCSSQTKKNCKNVGMIVVRSHDSFSCIFQKIPNKLFYWTEYTIKSFYSLIHFLTQVIIINDCKDSDSSKLHWIKSWSLWIIIQFW